MSLFYYRIWVCLTCGRQARGPGGHHVAGDDSCSGCAAGQPTLAHIDVEIRDTGTKHHLARARRDDEKRREELQAERALSGS